MFKALFPPDYCEAFLHRLFEANYGRIQPDWIPFETLRDYDTALIMFLLIEN